MSGETELERLVVRLTGEKSEYDKTLDDAMKSMHDTSQNLQATAAEMEEKLAKSVEHLTTKIQEQVATFGMSANQVDIYKLAMAGATDQQLEAARAAAQLQEQLQEEAKHAEEAGYVTEGMMTRAVIGAELFVHALEHVVEKLSEFRSEALHAYQAHELAEVKLKGAIEANGHSVEITMKRYEEFAGEMSKLTTFGKVATEELLQQAESYGLTGDAAMRAAKNTIAMQKSIGQGSIRMMALLEQGDVGRLSRMLAIPKEITDDAEKAAFAQEKLAKMFKVAQAEAGTSSGQMQQLGKAVHGLMAELGETIANGLKPFIDWGREVITWMREVDPATKKVVVVMSGLLIALTGALGGLILMAAYLPTVATHIITVNNVAMKFIQSTGHLNLALGALAASAVILTIMAIRDAMNQSTEAANKASAAFSEMADKKLKALATMPNKERNEGLDQELKRRQAQAKIAQDELDAATEKQNKQGFFKGLQTGGAKLVFGADSLAPLKKEVEETAKQLKEAQEMADKFNIHGALDKATKAGSELLTKLKLMNDTFGMSDSAAAVYKAKIDGATEAELKQAKALSDTIEKKKESAEVDKKVQELTDKLQDQTTALGMTAERAEIYKLGIENLTDAELEYLLTLASEYEAAKKLADVKKDMDKLIEKQGETIETWGMAADEAEIYKLKLRGVSDEQLAWATSNMEVIRGLQKQKDLMEKGKQVTNQYRTSLQKFDDSKKELDELFGAGAISSDTYTAALKDAEDQLNKTGKAMKSLKMENAALSGSAEAISRIEQYSKEVEFKAGTAKKAKGAPKAGKGPRTKTKKSSGPKQSGGGKGGGRKGGGRKTVSNTNFPIDNLVASGEDNSAILTNIAKGIDRLVLLTEQDDGSDVLKLGTVELS